MPRLQAVCKENKTEENLNNLAEDLDYKDFALSPGECHVIPMCTLTFALLTSTEVAVQLQSHCHWLLELAIVIVSAIAEGESHVVSIILGLLLGPTSYSWERDSISPPPPLECSVGSLTTCCWYGH